MPRRPTSRHRPPRGPSQRQLRAGELVRHALVDILRAEELKDTAMKGVSVTLSEVRVSADLKHALCFVEPLGGERAGEVVDALNRSARFLRGQLGRIIEMRFTPDLKFIRDETFTAAAHMSAVLADPRVRRDVEALPDGESD